MTREDLENLVIEATGRSDKISLIRTAINLALEDLSTKHNWLDLQVEGSVTATEGSSSVDLGDDVSRVTEVRVIDSTLSRPLFVRPKTWLMSRCPDPSTRSTARPVYGYLEGSNLVLIPRPNQDYEIRFTHYRVHPAMTASSDELLIKVAGACVAAYATFWVFQCIEKFAEAKQWYETYVVQLNSAKKLDKDNTAVKQEADRRGDEVVDYGDYWLDPFVTSMP